MTPRKGEEGYALIVAIMSMILFALMALTMINATRGTVIMASAELDRARLSAAADAGLALAIQGLSSRDPALRWSIAGQPRRIAFDDMVLTIVIEDERGKIALNDINKGQVEMMFAAFGLSGGAMEEAVDGFLDWRDEDGAPRLRGAERDVYEKRRIKARNGPLRSIGELALIAGVGPALAAKIAPIATVNPGSNAGFDPRFASPIAIKVSADNEVDAASAELALGRAIRGETVAIDLSASPTLVGRPLTVRVEAARGARAKLRRQTIIELTGARLKPYIVRARE
ncbi:MAG: general secretion pathway protein GspK [Sphingomonadaceae bacterium]